MFEKLWNRYLRIWPVHSWLKIAAGWGALIALILLAIPEYFLPWDGED